MSAISGSNEAVGLTSELAEPSPVIPAVSGFGFTMVYRASFYLMLVCASLVLNIDATDNKLSMLYPVVVAAGAVIALLTVDRAPGSGITPSFGGFLALGATGLALLEFLWDRNLLLLALGHWLVYLQLIYIFRDKTVETDWWMFSLGLVQVMVGAVISQESSVGFMLLAWAILSLWVLGLFSLQRESLRSQSLASDPSSSIDPTDDPYPGLLSPAFFFSAMRVTATTLALGGIIFLAMPRRAGMSRSLRGDTRAQHLTGFDDEVQLGQLGEILENDSVVMAIEMYDEHDEPIVPQGEPLWRGATMSTYEKGRWRRQERRTKTFPVFQGGGVRTFSAEAQRGGVIRQQIKLEPNDSQVLFGLRPMIDASAKRQTPELNPIDGTIFRTEVRSGSFDYEVRSYQDQSLIQPGENVPGPFHDFQLREVPDELREQLRTLANSIIEKRVEPEKRNDVRARAEALDWYLRESGEFGYTLNLDVVDPNLDPVLDFLVNRKQGHCEYFASALTLLLRSVDIPARMVNGFKGGDWNDLARIMNVRQKHAHSWVEAYLGELGQRDRRPLWLTLDPTPGNERSLSVAQVGGMRKNFRQVTDLIRYVWVFYVVGFDSERQNRAIYGPIRALFDEARAGFRIMGDVALKAWTALKAWLNFPTLRSLFSVRGFAVAFVGMCLLYGILWILSRVYRRVRAWLVGPDADAALLGAGAAQYRRLVQLLAEFGLERPPAETQGEFARRATVFLSGRGSSTLALAEVPRAVVNAFYRARFGNHPLSEDAVGELEARLDQLEAQLRSPHA
ncbi:MAG: DUF3488 and transglutaminase-like domain-containing protein [Isosphaeraceae bacterium]